MQHDGTSTDDLVTALRAADPLARADLDRVDPDALLALRTAVLASGARPAVRGPRRWARRAAAVGGALALLVGGGAAYAGYQDWYGSDGGADGITCSLDYGPLGETGELTSGGPALTGDPVADCARYQELAGLPPIEDPVAFRDAWHPVVVVPRDRVPDGAELLDPAGPADLTAQELESSVHDLVDGPVTGCLDPAAAAAAAQAELDRLSLGDWEVDVDEDAGTGACAGVVVDAGGRRLTVVATGPVESLETLVARGDVVPEVLELRDELRTGIADTCLDLTEAEAVVAQALGTAHHWPTSAVEDPAAACTRVDLEVGGSIQVTLRGPRPAAG
ncbi:MAG: hypothetical protein IE923_13985 [Micrococcales bacterium]|nr:hypothetical protein [Micrococcales bacterium]